MHHPNLLLPRTAGRLAPLFAVLLALALTPPAAGVLHLPEIHTVHDDFDARTGSLSPSPEALALVDSLDATARWNRFGTVHVLFRPGGFVDTGLQGEPEAAARAWIRDHRALFGLSEAGVDDLELARESVLSGGSARVLHFVQQAGAVPVLHEGAVKVGLVDGNLFWVASSSIGDPGVLAPAELSAAEAWVAAATGLGFAVSLGDVLGTSQDGTWTLLDVAGLEQPQRVRPVALGVPGAGAVPAYETIVLDFADGEMTGYTTFVDAKDGRRLVGQNRVWQAASGSTTAAALLGEDAPADQRTEVYSGSYPPSQATECGPCTGPFTAADGEDWVRIVVSAAASNSANDIFFDVYHGDPQCLDNAVLHGDLLFSPEVAVYEPEGGIPAGDYFVQVCPFNSLQIEPTDYVGSVTFERSPEPGFNPKWRHFPANPPLDHASVDTRELGCWFDTLTDGTPIAECDGAFGWASSHNITWDFEPNSNVPSFTTTGNNARGSEAWAAFLSGGGAYQPAAADRRYDFLWTNEWFESKCDPTRIVHGGLFNDNDIDAAIANLFVQHNRVHDWAYHLGLRERAGAAQVSNFGQTSPVRQNDPELGNAQAGAATGGAAGAYLGRDNANQLTLNDGIAPLTNMYLWQTIGGAIYVPCVDGDFDTAVIAHEYGHLIQNRMVDPDNGLSGNQGRAMGESWSDLTAVEFLNGWGLVPTGSENPFAVGAYVTGDSERGIRNYSMDDSPLNYSNVGYDFICTTDLVSGNCTAITQVHADGEIWSAANFDVRQALAAKYDGSFPSGDAVLQERCAAGEVPADQCPGNRRWAQVMHDAFLLVPSQPSMVDARDAYLAADLARAGDPAQSWPSNQEELWGVFARRGFGQGAESTGSADADPRPDFASPLEDNATVRFELLGTDGVKTGPSSGTPIAGEVYVGRYEARSNPVADTHSGTALGDAHAFAPGTYDLVARADGYGHMRFSATFDAGDDLTLEVRMPANWASQHQGASAGGAGTRHASLIDDTEATNWERLGAIPSVDVERPRVTVSLSGRQQVARVQVSGMLQAVLGEGTQNRFSSLDGFRLLACDATTANCSLESGYTEVFRTDPEDFPSADLRPLVQDTLIRAFDVTDTAATHLILEVLDNKCTGTAKYKGYLGQPGADDNDPLNGTSCETGSPPAVSPKNTDVRAAELQVFSGEGAVRVQRGNN